MCFSFHMSLYEICAQYIQKNVPLLLLWLLCDVVSALNQ
jgi:hypothetical protein